MSAATSGPVSARVDAARADAARGDAARCWLRGLLAADPPTADEVAALTVLGVPWLQQQGLAALTWVRCAKAVQPPVLAQTLRAAYFAAVADTELHRHELQTILPVLAALGSVPVVFKGAALAYTVYPDPACRLMSDIDLWISADELPRARAALETIGYRVSPNPDRPAALMEQFNGEIGLAHARADLGLIELHWSLFVGEWLRLTTRIDEAAVWARTTRSALLDQPVRLLAPEDAVLHLLVHAGVNHQFSLAVLRTCVDVALLARATPLAWAAIADRAQQWRIATVTWLGLTLAVDLIGLAEARSILPRLAPARWRQAALQRIVTPRQIVDQQDWRAGRQRFMLLLLLVDRKRDAIKLIFRTLWPERAWLAARYGRCTCATRWQHLFGALRGRV